MPLSLTARLALLFALVAASLLILIGVLLGQAVEGHFGEIDDHELRGKLVLIENLLQRANTPLAREQLPQRLDEAFVGHDGIAVLLRNGAGVVSYALHPTSFEDELLARGQPGSGVSRWKKNGSYYVGRAKTVRLQGPEGMMEEASVAVALDVTHHTKFLEATSIRLWLGIALAAIIAALLGWWVAHGGLAPLRRVTAIASGLSAERLGERLKEGDAPVEVRELVDAFNGMLGRLESAFQRLSDFSADIAHELRTPISNLMTQTAVSLSRTRSEDEYREVLTSNLEEYQRIARMVTDMLFLAKADNGRLPNPNERVALANEARALAEFYEALAEERDVSVVVRGEATISGDRLMLRRAISNLLSNALRHSRPGSTIEIDVADQGSHVTLGVRNRGDTIPVDQQPRIFERFHRASAERQHHGEGAGLGLAITRSIVQAHGGEVDVESANGITEFQILLPHTVANRPVTD
ncbi:heavy metal sensor histidine kinase [Aromatoleum evansii]|nr:heavy metal sensor histidine kinase [Aromatoleum evansii]NMG29993.1 heavy metal sensor histidine kinase [Aromatoleum evansii]